MAAYKSKGTNWQEAIALERRPLPDPLAKYYLIWRQNCLDSIKWLAGIEIDPAVPCNYSPEKIEWLTDYYEQRALLWWCKAKEAGLAG